MRTRTLTPSPARRLHTPHPTTGDEDAAAALASAAAGSGGGAAVEERRPSFRDRRYGGRERPGSEELVQPYEILGEQHRDMEVQRYLQARRRCCLAAGLASHSVLRSVSLSVLQARDSGAPWPRSLHPARGALPRPPSKMPLLSLSHARTSHPKPQNHNTKPSLPKKQMEFDPRLDAIGGTSPPAPWRAAAGGASEREFLDAMRPQLDAHLEGGGAAPLDDADWREYRDRAVEEFEAFRVSQERALRAAGGSGFFSARAEAQFLRGALRRGLAPGSPLAAAGPKYLEAVLANPSWSFYKRRHLVKRLGEISHRLAAAAAAAAPAGGRAAARGSPFSPLFMPGGPPLALALSRERRPPRQPYMLPAALQPSAAAAAAAAGGLPPSPASPPPAAGAPAS